MPETNVVDVVEPIVETVTEAASDVADGAMKIDWKGPAGTIGKGVAIAAALYGVYRGVKALYKVSKPGIKKAGRCIKAGFKAIKSEWKTEIEYKESADPNKKETEETPVKEN
jgi:hypothetical protein